MSNDEITVSLTSLSTQSTESINISKSSTTLGELVEFAGALLGISSPILLKEGKRLNFTNVDLNRKLSSIGINHGDLIVVASSNQESLSAPESLNASASTGGLDFSNLLNNSTNSSTSAPKFTSASSSDTNTSGLVFNIPFGLVSNISQTAPVEWDGMTLNDAIARNPKPEAFVQVLLSERHPNLFKEFNYHHPVLANRIKNARGLAEASTIWRETIQKSSLGAGLERTLAQQKEHEMNARLKTNPKDEEANKYFGEKLRKQGVQEQYESMMEQYPEAMGRVLMLYIDTEVNGKHVQAFVDSGAQNTIMSSKCADTCGLLHLLDTRFEGTAVGIGTGKILGRIHIAQIKVNDHYFPCSITVMDSDNGLGDKNMEFLLGLDMLKRHRCNIDLENSQLVFNTEHGKIVTPFLHEKDLSESKGGTKGFDYEKSNRELEKMMNDAERKGSDKNPKSENK
jgi:hypothetical protein